MTVESLIRSTISEEHFTILFELLLWINPVKSLCFVTGVHVGLFCAYSFISKGPLYVFSLILLFKLWNPIWNQKIWPSIQLPEFARLNDWLTLNPEIPPYSETVSILSKFIDDCLLPIQSLLCLRKSDPSSFLMYTSILCIILIFVGQTISGFVLSYLFLMIFLFTPLLAKNTILGMIDAESAPEEPKKVLLPQKPSGSSIFSSERETDSDNISTYTESEAESDGNVPRRESVYDPLAEPTWMEDFGHKISENISNVGQVIEENVSNVKKEIEEAISMSLSKDRDSSGSESADSEKSDFVLLSTEDAKTK